jgi:hypothetical protein
MITLVKISKRRKPTPCIMCGEQGVLHIKLYPHYSRYREKYTVCKECAQIKIKQLLEDITVWL